MSDLYPRYQSDDTPPECIHDWELVQKQTLFEGFRVTLENPMSGDEGYENEPYVLAVVHDRQGELWQNVEDCENVRIQCSNCGVVLPDSKIDEIEWRR